MPATFAHPVFHFIVGKYSSQGRAPVYPGFAQVCQPVFHQYIRLLFLIQFIPFFLNSFNRKSWSLISEPLNQCFNRFRFIYFGIVPWMEQLQKNPLCPFVIIRVGGFNFTVPIKRKPDFIKLLAVTFYVLFGGNGRMLSCLNGILLGRQSEWIIPHRVKHIVTTVAFIPGNNVRSDVAERMTYMQSGSWRIRKHIQRRR